MTTLLRVKWLAWLSSSMPADTGTSAPRHAVGGDCPAHAGHETDDAGTCVWCAQRVAVTEQGVRGLVHRIVQGLS